MERITCALPTVGVPLHESTWLTVGTI